MNPYTALHSSVTIRCTMLKDSFCYCSKGLTASSVTFIMIVPERFPSCDDGRRVAAGWASRTNHGWSGRRPPGSDADESYGRQHIMPRA
jgi:hypothetical protein